MKIAITGKGGVGKSTLTALLARALHDDHQKVLLIDADPDMSLGVVAGFSNVDAITPISEMKELIAERTETTPGQSAPLFKLNPRVDDIPDRFSVTLNGIKLMVMGTLSKGGGGCACPENAFLKTLLSHLVFTRDEWVLVDMVAGIEHLGRATAQAVDHMIVVVEPNQTSIATARRIRKLSGDLKISSVKVVGSKIRTPAEMTFIQNELPGFEILGYIPFSEEILLLSRRQKSLFDVSPESLAEIRKILGNLGHKI